MRRRLLAVDTENTTDDEDVADLDAEDLPQPQHYASQSADRRLAENAASSTEPKTSVDDESVHVTVYPVQDEGSPHEDVESGKRKKSTASVVPIVAVLITSCVGLLSLSEAAGGNAAATFSWFSAVTSIASLQSWSAMLYTYIRWHKGTKYHEQKARKDMEIHAPTHKAYEKAQETMENITRIKTKRHWGQPWLAYYALTMCILILLSSGMSVFFHSGWRIATLVSDANERNYSTSISLFLASYIPIPGFIFLTLGYKLVKQTSKVKLEDMVFYGKNFKHDDPEDPLPNPQTDQSPPERA